MSAAHRLFRGAPLVLIGLLAACAGHRQQQSTAPPAGPHAAGQGYYRVGAPYEVSGVWYYPRVDYHYDRTGIASWYGPGYDGRLTANGEIFDMNGLSAAHPTLPLPSVVRVTNLQNGRSLDLRVNDRGPFVADRIIDLSRRAAQLLGFEGQGTAPVHVSILKRQSIEVAELAREGIIAGGVMLARAAPVAAPEPPVRVARAALPAPPVALARAALPAPLPSQLPPPKPAPVEVAAASPPPPYEPPVYEPPARIAEPRLTPRHVHLAAYPLPGVAPVRAAEPRPSRQYVHLVAYRLPGVAPARAAEPRPAGYHVRPAAYRPVGRIFVQAGAFSVEHNASRVRARVAGLASVRISTAAVNGATLYRVRLGPFANVAEADRVLSRVIRSGCPGARLVFD